jgi:hypothetical protein
MSRFAFTSLGSRDYGAGSVRLGMHQLAYLQADPYDPLQIATFTT